MVSERVGQRVYMVGAVGMGGDELAANAGSTHVACRQGRHAIWLA